MHFVIALSDRKSLRIKLNQRNIIKVQLRFVLRLLYYNVSSISLETNDRRVNELNLLFTVSNQFQSVSITPMRNARNVERHGPSSRLIYGNNQLVAKSKSIRCFHSLRRTETITRQQHCRRRRAVRHAVGSRGRKRRDKKRKDAE